MRLGGLPEVLATKTARPVSRSRPTVWSASSNGSPTGISLVIPIPCPLGARPQPLRSTSVSRQAGHSRRQDVEGSSAVLRPGVLTHQEPAAPSRPPGSDEVGHAVSEGELGAGLGAYVDEADRGKHLEDGLWSVEVHEGQLVSGGRCVVLGEERWDVALVPFREPEAIDRDKPAARSQQ